MRRRTGAGRPSKGITARGIYSANFIVFFWPENTLVTQNSGQLYYIHTMLRSRSRQRVY